MLLAGLTGPKSPSSNPSNIHAPPPRPPQEFFVLNGFVTDHVALVQAVGMAYKCVRATIHVLRCLHLETSWRP